MRQICFLPPPSALICLTKYQFHKYGEFFQGICHQTLLKSTGMANYSKTMLTHMLWTQFTPNVLDSKLQFFAAILFDSIFIANFILWREADKVRIFLFQTWLSTNVRDAWTTPSFKLWHFPPPSVRSPKVNVMFLPKLPPAHPPRGGGWHNLAGFRINSAMCLD